LAVGSVAVFNLANNLQYLVIGIIGISYATASFPTFSHEVASKQKQEFARTFATVVRQILFLVLPLSVLLFVLRAQVVRVVLGAGVFSWEDTRLTAAVLGIFCIGIVAHSLIPVIARAFYASQDTWTPVRINLFGVALNIILSVAFVFVFLQDGMAPWLGMLSRVGDLANIPLLGLPLAFAISGIVTVFILFSAFFARHGGVYKKEIWASFIRLTVLSLAAGVAAYGALRLILLIPAVSLETFMGVFVQGLGAGLVGIGFYIAGLFVLQFPEKEFLRRLLNRKM
jgi:putative peptidoglycan lipid II flippase